MALTRLGPGGYGERGHGSFAGKPLVVVFSAVALQGAGLPMVELVGAGVPMVELVGAGRIETELGGGGLP